VAALFLASACASFASTPDPGDAGSQLPPPAVVGPVPPGEVPPFDAGLDTRDSAPMPDASACPGKNLDSDPDNCGACGHACNPLAAVAGCVGGECERLVFLLQTTLPANFGGLTSADTICTNAATMSGADPSGTQFKAWLSTETISVSTRMVHGKRPYIDKHGDVVAADWNALVSGSLTIGIRWTEAGNSIVDADVWTATTASGDYAGPSDCMGWTSPSQMLMSTFGRSNAANAGWTQFGTSETCNTPAHLYCIEQ
jgi:hypothetical protein